MKYLMPALLLLAAPLLVSPGAAFACNDHADASPVNMSTEPVATLSNAWTRATPKSATSAAIYLSFKNNSSTPMHITAVETPVAARAEIHETTMADGIAQMRPVKDMALPANSSIAFAPGGTHIMLTGLAQPLKAGDSFPVTLTFDSGEQMKVSVKVQAATTKAEDGHMQHMQMH